MVTIPPTVEDLLAAAKRGDYVRRLQEACGFTQTLEEECLRLERQESENEEDHRRWRATVLGLLGVPWTSSRDAT